MPWQSVGTLRRPYRTLYADGAVVTQTYEEGTGRLLASTDPDGVVTLYGYNEDGEQDVQAIDLNQDGVIDYDGTDQVTRTVRSLVEVEEEPRWRTDSFVWATLNVDTPTLVSRVESTLDGRWSWRTVDGQVTENREELPGDGDRLTTVTLPDGSQVISEYEAGQQTKVERYDGETLLSRQSFTYDPHGRLATVTDEADGVTSYTYDAADRVIAVTTPDPDGEGPASPLVSQTVYDVMGRVSETIEPDSTSRYQTYHPTSEVARTWGTRTYPVDYTYEMGRLKTLTTWQDFAGETGAAVTTWIYDSERGWLNQKKYADDTGPIYTYTAGGRLASRTWARGVSTGCWLLVVIGVGIRGRNRVSALVLPPGTRPFDPDADTDPECRL